MPRRDPSPWESGPDADEWAGDRGEALQSLEDEFDYSGHSRHAAGPYHAAEYHRLEGGRYDEW